MKKLLIVIAIITATTTAKAQAYDSSANYADTLITLQLTQRAAVYIGYYTRNYKLSWANRNAPTIFKSYVGTGTHLDSLFTVTLSAWYVTGMIDLLLTGQNQVVYADQQSVIFNSPTISGYTALATQITNKANGSTSEKNVATYILSYYNAKVAALAALRTQIITDVVNWSRQ